MNDTETPKQTKRGYKPWLWLLLLLLLVGVLAAFLIWNTKREDIARNLVIEAITKNGSCEVDLGELQISRDGGTVELGPTLFANPAIPSETPMLEIASLKAELSPFALLSGELKLKNLDLHVPQITLVRKADGSTNADCLGTTLGTLLPRVPKPKSTSSGGGEKGTDPASPPPSSKPKRSVVVSLHRLHLRIDNVSVRDFGRGGPIPLSADVEVGFDETYEDLLTLEDLEARLKADAEKIVDSLLIY